MQIVELRAENIKRISAVAIKPEGPVVEITGRNEQGKSSVLDSIWLALGGAEAIPKEPIRKGQEKASVTLDLGELKVTRKFTRKEDGEISTTLTVETADGMRPKSPQTLLNELVGRFTLDPLAFSKMAPAAQFDAMKALVPDYDFDASIAADKADYEKRTAVNRKLKEYRAAAEAIPLATAQHVDDAPILEQMAKAGDHNAGISERKARREQASNAARSHRGRADAIRLEIENHRKRIAELEVMATQADKEAEELEAKLAAAAPLPEPIDTAALAEKLARIQKDNAVAATQVQRKELLNKAAEAEAESKALTAHMEDRAQRRAEAIAAAKLPVEGLTLGESEVLVDGLPFANAAASKKIRISVALAMALNPKIRVIRIMDGSLLDADAQKIVHDMAAEHGFQVWIETVQSGSPGAVVIEDGQVKL